VNSYLNTALITDKYRKFSETVFGGRLQSLYVFPMLTQVHPEKWPLKWYLLSH